MGSEKYNYTLLDLLCLIDFQKIFKPAQYDYNWGYENYDKAIIEWAEHEVISGHESEPLLILASLGLDKIPNHNDVHHYLNQFITMAGISYPGKKLSALNWLKIRLWTLSHCDDVRSVKCGLSFFNEYSFDYMPRFFAKTSRYLGWLHDYLFDYFTAENITRADQMPQDEVLAFIRNHVKFFEQKLHNEEWISILARE